MLRRLNLFMSSGEDFPRRIPAGELKQAQSARNPRTTAGDAPGLKFKKLPSRIPVDQELEARLRALLFRSHSWGLEMTDI